MNLEQLKSPTEDAPESAVESVMYSEKLKSIFGKSLRCFKRWHELGIVIGAVLVAGEITRENGERDKEYDTYVRSSLSSSELKEKGVAETELRNLFGEDAVSDIYFGDRDAFFEKSKQGRKEPEIGGFIERGWTNYQKYVFSEKFLSYPKGWINGEVGQIKFIDKLKHDSEKTLTGGEFGKGFFSEPKIYLYRSQEGNLKDEKFPSIMKGTIEHELGHANDWETDMDLNIRERQQLLIEIHRRLTASDCWHRDNNDHYHETFADGSKEGLYKSAREYWAEICGEYFSNPKVFFTNHPKDFKLVDTYAKKNDPSFDVFHKDRHAFDPDTGELRDVWKDK